MGNARHVPRLRRLQRGELPHQLPSGQCHRKRNARQHEAWPHLAPPEPLARVAERLSRKLRPQLADRALEHRPLTEELLWVLVKERNQRRGRGWLLSYRSRRNYRLGSRYGSGLKRTVDHRGR